MPSALSKNIVQPSHSPEALEELVLAQRAFFAAGYTRSYRFRKGQLNVLRQAIRRYENQITAALQKDLGKDAFEAYGTEIGQVYAEISFAEKHLKSWMQPQHVGTPFMFFPSSSRILAEPRGTSLILAPWNYPFILLFRPLVSAIAAGNTAIIKPSEETPHTAAVIRQMVSETWEEDFIACVLCNGPYVHEHLSSRYSFGLLFFTGTASVGSIVMRDAAKHLTPVVLELGGKSPAIVAPDASIAYTARKIAFGKWMNAGQTCVAVDYVLVHESVKDRLVEKLIEIIRESYGEDPQQSTSYGRIINQKHFARLTAYLDNLPIKYGGKHDADDLYLSPTIIDNPPEESALMHDEIFGPILPIITFKTLDEAAAFVHRHPNPLSLYVFTNSSNTESYFMDHISFGGGCVNNVLVHLGNPRLPFGGVGRSGMGSYVGKKGFDTFTHYKSIVRSPSWFDLPMWYAPRKSWYLNALKKLLK